MRLIRLNQEDKHKITAIEVCLSVFIVFAILDSIMKYEVKIIALSQLAGNISEPVSVPYALH